MSTTRTRPEIVDRQRVLAALAAMILAWTPGCAGVRPGGQPWDVEPSASGTVGKLPPLPAIGAAPRTATDAQPGDPIRVPDDRELRKASVSSDPAIAQPTIPPSPSTLPIDLPSALRLADKANPIIGESRARIGEALGQQLQARVLLLPTLNAGASYDGHAGLLQQSTGRIIKVDRQSLYLGGGASAVASGTVSIPAVNIAAHLGDAIFEPLAARQQVAVVEFDASATVNSVLLGVAVEYLELQAAANDLAARRRTEAEAAEVARITAQYARTGQGRQADADRARTQRQLRLGEIRRAEERVAVASARLARRLHLDPSATIEPANAAPEVFALIEPDANTEDLIRVALHRRPEVKARSAGIAVAETRARQERARPFLPTLWLGYSGGAYGGGSNLTPPLLGSFAGRTDFDAFAYWSLLNFGAGNLASIKRQDSRVGLAVADRDRVINMVREEVASSRAEALARREKLRIAIEQLTIAQDGYRKDLERIQQAAGPPLEVLNNLNLLRKARESVIEAVLGYNQAQFRLFVAMGSPPPLELPTQPAVPSSSIEALAANPTRAEGGASSSSSEKAGAVSGSDLNVAAAGGETGSPSDGFESLDRAKKASARAANEYDRLQAELFKTLGSAGKSPSREETARGLAALAEAHRAELTARVEYDKALWRLMTDPKTKPTERGSPEASIPPGP